MNKKEAIPAITRGQMREIDRLMMDGLGISFFMMAENAAREIARVARDQAGNGRRVLVLAGTGGNGGDGLITARRLSGWGYEPRVILVGGRVRDEINILSSILVKMKIFIQSNSLGINELFAWADIIVDSLLGYGASGNPRGEMVKLIEMANNSGKTIVSVDMPTGLDADTGAPAEFTIKARHTVSIGLPKVGLLKDAASLYVGKLWLCDIGIPPSLYKEIGVEVGPIFRDDTLISI
ncbi:MAG: NAD(P)H-hydrate epimerase [Parcubacteria group bacterium]|nr:NAD(P)H-hydrate epimerase [Parcubacteria group bacterium]